MAFVSTLVNISASQPITTISGMALTLEAILLVDTIGMFIARVQAKNAFVLDGTE